MPKLLFDNIDEPGLNTLEVYRRRGGYEALTQALAPMVKDTYLADLIACLAMLDPILGGIDR